MHATLNQTAQLIDRLGRDLGSIAIDEVEGNLRMGQFTPGADYDCVRSVFDDFAEAVDCQALSAVDEIDKLIDAFGIRLVDGTPIHDVQIYRDGNASFRITVSPERNGAH